jgi:hypothetical protein
MSQVDTYDCVIRRWLILDAALAIPLTVRAGLATFGSKLEVEQPERLSVSGDVAEVRHQGEQISLPTHPLPPRPAICLITHMCRAAPGATHFGFRWPLSAYSAG